MAPVAAGIAILVAGVVPPSRDPRTPPVDWSGDVAIRCSTSDCSETPRFTAASGAVTVAFFALSGFIFLVTQYFQFLKAYSPFATGVRLLPVAASVAISSLVGTRLAVRVGQAGGDHRDGPDQRAGDEGHHGVVSKEQAGVGSAVNDATRLLGGTLGVAVIGSVAASLYAGRLGSTLPAGLPAAVREAATGSVGGPIVAAQRAAAGGLGAAADQLRIAAIQAFEHSFAAGCLVALGVAAAGALVAWFALLPARPRRAIPAAGSTLPAAHSRPLSRLRAAG